MTKKVEGNRYIWITLVIWIVIEKDLILIAGV